MRREMRRKGSKTSVLLGVTLLSLCCSVTAFEELTIKELHKVMRHDDLSGGQQNIKVVLDNLDTIDADGYDLILSDGVTQTKKPCDSLPGASDNHIFCEGNFVNTLLIFVNAYKDGIVVASGSLSVNIKDPGSRVALVGSSDAPSLRVDPGERKQVEVPGRVPCVKGSGPCYYLGQGRDSLTPPELCEEINGFKFCDDIVSKLLDSEDPTVELHNREKLIVGSEPRTEVVILAPGGGDPLSEDFVCNDNGDGTCSYSLEVGDAVERFHVMVVVLDEEGYVTGSALVDFEVHRVSTSWLTDDVLKVSVNPQSNGEYKVELLGFRAPQVMVHCEADDDCPLWFGTANKAYAIKVWKGRIGASEDVVRGMLPNKSSVKKITSMKDNTRIQVVGNKDVKQVHLIDFKDDNTALKENCVTLDAFSAESGYYLDASPRDSGVWQLVVVGYGEDKTLVEASHTFVNLPDLNGMVSVVGAGLGSPGASLRVDVGALDNVEVEGVGTCTKENSPCYFLQKATHGDAPKHCVSRTNEVGGKEVDICDDSYTEFRKMFEPILELVDGTILEVTTTAKENFVEVVVFNPNDGTQISTSQECIRPGHLSCSQSVCIPEELQDLLVLVVALAQSGGETSVQESVLVPFCDLKTHFQVMTLSQELEVRWTSPSERNFTVHIVIDGPLGSRTADTSLTCGGPGEDASRNCKAYFADLESEKIQKVEVKYGANTMSLTEATSQTPISPLVISRISKISKSPSLLEVSFSSETGVVGVSSVEFVWLGNAGKQIIFFTDFHDNIAKGENIVQFSSELPKTSSKMELLLVAHGTESVDCDVVAFGRATANLQDIALPKLTKTGKERMRSLRVETKSIEVAVNGEKCAEHKVCYILEAQELSEPPEVCRMAGEGVEQCDMTAEYLTPQDMGDPGVELAFGGVTEQDLIVSTNFSETSDTMDAVIYNGSVIDYELDCPINRGIWETCTFKLTPIRNKFKILLMALNETQDVVETTVISFEDLKTRFQVLGDAQDLEVNWQSSECQTFTVQVSTEGGTQSREEPPIQTVVCGGGSGGTDGGDCNAYFIELESADNLKVEVISDSNVVSATTPTNGITKPLVITRITHISESSSQMEVTFTSENVILRVKHFEFVVIDSSSGESVDRKMGNSSGPIFKGVSEVYFNAELPTTGKEVYILFTAYGVEEDTPNALAFGKALVCFEDFKTRFQILSEDQDVEVRWESPRNQRFTVQLFSDGVNETDTTCGGNRTCMAYFTSSKEITSVAVIRGITAESVAVPTSRAKTTELIISRVSQVLRSPSRLEVTFSSPNDVSDVSFVELVMLDAPIPGDNVKQSITFTDFDHDIEEGGNFASFDVELPKARGVTILLVAHTAESIVSDAPAFGKAFATFEDMSLPRLTKVGSEELESLKVEKSSMEVEVNGKTCPPDTVCYFLEPETFPEPPEVCRKAAPKVEQCDMTTNYLSPQHLVDPMVELKYSEASNPNLVIITEYNETSVFMEVVVYSEPGVVYTSAPKCGISRKKRGTCEIEMETSDKSFAILLIALDGSSNVVETNAIAFEDFQTKVQQLTSTVIEVRWNTSRRAQFDVELDSVAGRGISSLSAECGGGDMCSVYFINLEPNGHYVASVSRSGERHRVSNVVNMTPNPEEAITIKKISLSTTDGSNTELNACFVDENLPEDNEGEDLQYSLVVIDVSGHQRHSVFAPAPSEDVLCLGPLLLGQNFDMKEKVTVYVKREKVLSAGGTDLYLLDPYDTVKVKQLSSNTLRVRWVSKNGASKFWIKAGIDELTVEAKPLEENTRYLHPYTPVSKLLVTLKELGYEPEQEILVTVEKNPFTDLNVMHDLNWDGRVRACFIPVAGATDYLLGFEDDERLVQEFAHLLPQEEDGLTCVLSSGQVKAGGYVSLTTVLTAFSKSGAVLASNDTQFEEFFLSPNRRVITAFDSDNKVVLVSWFLLDDPQTISEYHVSLEKSSGGIQNSQPVDKLLTTHMFKDVNEGRHTTCVAASVEKGEATIQSKKICSAIISLSNNQAPSVHTVELKSTQEDSFHVTWENPGSRVAGFVVTWRQLDSRSPLRHSSPTLPKHLLQLAEKGLRESYENFKIVPAYSTSTDISGITKSKNYEACVYAVADALGHNRCEEINMETHIPIDKPKNLDIGSGELQWSPVGSAEKYLVEWRPRSEGEEGGQVEIDMPQWSMEGLSPGEWVLSVRATKNSSASEPESIEFIQKGIVIAPPVQLANNLLLLEWWEEPQSCGTDSCKYIIYIYNNGGNSKVECSGRKGDCQLTANVPNQQGMQVEVRRDDNQLLSKRDFDMSNLPDVLPPSKEFTTGSSEVSLRWPVVEEASLYNVTLYANETSHEIKMTEFISYESYTIENAADGNVFQVQPCAQRTRCGNPTTVKLDRPSESTNTPIILVSVIGGVMIVALVIFLVLVIVKKMKDKKAEEEERRRAEENKWPVYNEWGSRPLGRQIPMTALKSTQRS